MPADTSPSVVEGLTALARSGKDTQDGLRIVARTLQSFLSKLREESAKHEVFKIQMTTAANMFVIHNGSQWTICLPEGRTTTNNKRGRENVEEFEVERADKSTGNTRRSVGRMEIQSERSSFDLKEPYPIYRGTHRASEFQTAADTGYTYQRSHFSNDTLGKTKLLSILQDQPNLGRSMVNFDLKVLLFRVMGNTVCARRQLLPSLHMAGLCLEGWPSVCALPPDNSWKNNALQCATMLVAIWHGSLKVVPWSKSQQGREFPCLIITSDGRGHNFEDVLRHSLGSAFTRVADVPGPKQHGRRAAKRAQREISSSDDDDEYRTEHYSPSASPPSSEHRSNKRIRAASTLFSTPRDSTGEVDSVEFPESLHAKVTRHRRLGDSLEEVLALLEGGAENSTERLCTRSNIMTAWGLSHEEIMKMVSLS